MNSGVGAILMGDSRGIGNLSELVAPAELIEVLRRTTAALIAAVEKNGGIVYQYVGGSVIAYWPPEKMPAAARDAVTAASDAIVACGENLAVSVAVADFAVTEVGERSMLVGAAHQRAEETLQVSKAGRVAVDSETLRVLPSDISDRFIPHEGYAQLA